MICLSTNNKDSHVSEIQPRVCEVTKRYDRAPSLRLEHGHRATNPRYIFLALFGAWIISVSAENKCQDNKKISYRPSTAEVLKNAKHRKLTVQPVLEDLLNLGNEVQVMPPNQGITTQPYHDPTASIPWATLDPRLQLSYLQNRPSPSWRQRALRLSAGNAPAPPAPPAQGAQPAGNQANLAEEQLAEDHNPLAPPPTQAGEDINAPAPPPVQTGQGSPPADNPHEDGPPEAPTAPPTAAPTGTEDGEVHVQSAPAQENNDEHADRVNRYFWPIVGSVLGVGCLCIPIVVAGSPAVQEIDQAQERLRQQERERRRLDRARQRNDRARQRNDVARPVVYAVARVRNVPIDEIENKEDINANVVEKFKDRLCAVCLENKATYICVPCGHQCLCASPDCRNLGSTNKCPKCREVLTSITRKELVTTTGPDGSPRTPSGSTIRNSPLSNGGFAV